MVWGTGGPTTIAFYVWCSAQNKTLMVDNLIQGSGGQLIGVARVSRMESRWTMSWYIARFIESFTTLCSHGLAWLGALKQVIGAYLAQPT